MSASCSSSSSSSTDKFNVCSVSGEDFSFSVHRPDDNGDVIDYTGWSAKLTAKRSLYDDGADLFSFDETDHVSLDQFDLDGVTQNIKVTIPASTTLALQAQGIRTFFIGLYLTPPDTQPESSPVQIIRTHQVTLLHSIAT